eukprot:SAG31_NODE_5099_length_2744_cov_2.713043_1_plen_250_part_00
MRLAAADLLCAALLRVAGTMASIASPPAAARSGDRGEQDAFIIKTNQNNCYGDPPSCWFRGRVPSAKLCQRICADDAFCRSFEWVGETGDRFQHECRTRNDTAWSLVAEGKHVAGHKGPVPRPPPFSCRNDTDCNNAGDCDTVSGRCSCDVSWRGLRCETLNLLPAEMHNGLQAVGRVASKRLNTWGGSIVAARPPAPKGYHMYASLFQNGTLNDWEHKSVIVHASSDHMQGEECYFLVFVGLFSFSWD